MKKISFFLLFCGISIAAVAQDLSISTKGVIEPLQPLTIYTNQGGRLNVLDGNGRLYLEVPIEDSLQFKVGGALGNQLALLLDAQGRILDQVSYKVEAHTAIEDGLKSTNFSNADSPLIPGISKLPKVLKG